MKSLFNYLAWTKGAAFSAVALCAALSSVHAQATFTGYGTGFDGTDVTNGVSSAAPYNTTTNAIGTQPLAGQNDWGSNDSAAGTVVNPTPGTYQVNGGTTTVGAFGAYTGNSGVIGGQYRAPGSTDPTSPDAVPSSASGGLVNLFHPVSAGAPQYVFNVDFDVTASTATAPGRDSFAFSLRNTTSATIVGSSLVSINFTPSTATTTDNVSYKVGNGAAVATGAAITISPATLYHLQITVNKGSANPTFTAILTGGTTTVNLTPTPVALGVGGVNVNQFSADWAVASTTVTNGGYTGAGTNALEFDNVAVTVPEPSTYAMMALGLVGLGALMRRKVA